MRLKKFIVHGFKSFADRTEFVFDAPITGIVGPNGCGKSNVVDGFKWVLGEQSAKSLRGDAMLDVIFNGSGGRKPAGMAEVTLVFENPKRDDGTRLLNLDTDDVAVGRRLYRDGTSEYQINNAASRLKDIKELFMDTGVGVDAYSVIEQGRVAALLEANPDERRQIFEEAAGISKYKVKKKEAQRKLEKVDQNLIRLNDIVEEVERRLRSVKVAAGKARNYKEYSDRLAELRLSYSLQEYHTLQTQIADLDKQRENLQFELDDAARDLALRQNGLAEKKHQFEALSTKKQEIETDLIHTQHAITSAQQRQQYANQQIEQISQQLAEYERDRELAMAKLEEVSKTLQADSENYESLTRELNEQTALIEQRQQMHRDGQLRLNQLIQQIEQGKQKILDLMHKLATVNSRIGGIEIERKNIASQQQRLADRRRIVVEEIEQLDLKRQDLQGKLNDALGLIDSLQHQLQEKRDHAADMGKQAAAIGEQLGSAKEHRSGLISRQKLLQDLESRREGVSEGVKSVLRQRAEKFPFIRGLVADVLKVDVEHARVIEAALDGRDQWLVTSDLSAAIAAREVLEGLEGRVNICGMGASPMHSPLERQEPQVHGQGAHGTGMPEGLLSIEVADAVVEVEPPYDWDQHHIGIRFAADLVRAEAEDQPLMRHLLGKTVVVDSLAEAHELHRNGPKGWRYVTHAGEVLERDGTLRAGPLTAAMGILSRRSELEAVSQQIIEVDVRIESLSAQLAETNAAAKALADEENSLRNSIYASNTQKVELTSAIAQTDDRRNSLLREQPLLDRELQAMLDQVGRLKDEETRLFDQRQGLENDQIACQQAIEQAAADAENLSEELKLWAEQLTTARVSLGQIQEKQLAAQQMVARHTASKNELEQQIDRLAKSAESVISRREQAEGELEDAKQNEGMLTRKQEMLSTQVSELTAQVSEASEQVESLTGEVDSFRNTHSEVEHELHGVDMKLGELRVRSETLVSRTMEEFQLDLPVKYAEALAAHNAKSQPASEELVHAASEQSEDAGSVLQTEESAQPVEATQDEPQSPFDPDGTDWDAVAEQIKELREKIQRLGNVNLDAITELEELETRQNFLTTQHTDLITSKQQLEELIETINKESAIRFEQTFNAVREHFQGMFRKLFGGGKADIYLETELVDTKATPTEFDEQGNPLPVKKKIDILDAGIEIIARPPGKQPATISQLSGGEKAMTCIALLMSIFKSKPSPFCILDEVDAPLDEANNVRFGMIIQEFLTNSQFIVITHHKRTMQICDQLYGVTMQEQGVSKRVQVKFDEVGANGQINAHAAA
jgi:chromosome segregation protein